MAEPTLNLTFDNLATQVSFLTNKGVTAFGSDTDVDNAVESGLRYAYFPAMTGEVDNHRWSWLRKTTSIVTVSGQQADGVDGLPDDFGSLVSDFVSPTGSHRVPVISDTQLLAADGYDTVTDAAPEYAAVRIKTAPTSGSSPEAGMRHEVLWHPTPDAAYTFTYTYDVMPDTASDGDEYPYGGLAHAELILEACLAAAELKILDRKGEHWDRFIMLLKASIEYDRAVYARQLNEPFPISKQSSTLEQHYVDLIINIGHYMRFGWDPAIWTHAQAETVELLKNRGVRQFMLPPVLQGERRAHAWRFLRPVAQIDVWQSQSVDSDVYISGATASGGTMTLTGVGTTFYASMVGHSIVITGQDTYTITGYTSATSISVAGSDTWAGQTTTTFSITADGDYRMPSDVAGVQGPLTHVPDDGECLFEVELYNEQIIRRHRQRDDSFTGRPLKAAVEPVKADGTAQYASDTTTSQAYNLMIWPLPDEDYVLEYRYHMVPVRMTTSVIYASGGAYHHETLMASCLCAAEMERDGQKGPQYENFMERLAASVSHDRDAFKAEKWGQNRDQNIVAEEQARRLGLRGPQNKLIVTYNP